MVLYSYHLHSGAYSVSKFRGGGNFSNIW